MVNLETLTARSLRHYELGRLRMAARVAIVLAPIVAICLLEPIGREACACCAALLSTTSVWLRFRNRAGVESVSTGLLAGGVPLAAALVLARVDPECTTAGLLSYCTGFSLLLGAAAGAVVALRERSRTLLASHWLLAIGVAVLTASLGCVRLGVASVVGVAVGLLVGHATMRSATATASG
jgi:hypothetical protein